MLLRGIGLKRAVRSTVILGAGASRGASFAGPAQQVLPPLDADFFQQAQRLDEQTFKSFASEVIDFVRDEYGASNLPTLETLFTELEGYDKFLQRLYVKRGRKPERYKKQLARLLDLIPVVFRVACGDQTCAWHDRIAFALRKEDAVISFNYDVLIDEALSRLATGIWLADRGYGFKIKDGTSSWSAKSTPGAFPTKTYLRLLKPHGSLHWADIDGAKKQLRLDTDAYGSRGARENIIPPTWDKGILGEWPWKPVWQEASAMLQSTRCLIVIGYSVPQTDLTSQALIRSSLSGGSLRLLVVANPDPRARGRVIDLARGAIDSRTRILELDSLREFAQLLDETPKERRNRQATSRRLRALAEQVQDLEELTGDLEWVELDDLEGRIDELENQDFDDLEERVHSIEGLDDRMDEIEARMDSLE
jgi:hypothetical protein